MALLGGLFLHATCAGRSFRRNYPVRDGEIRFDTTIWAGERSPHLLPCHARSNRSGLNDVVRRLAGIQRTRIRALFVRAARANLRIGRARPASACEKLACRSSQLWRPAACLLSVKSAGSGRRRPTVHVRYPSNSDQFLETRPTAASGQLRSLRCAAARRRPMDARGADMLC